MAIDYDVEGAILQMVEINNRNHFIRIRLQPEILWALDRFNRSVCWFYDWRGEIRGKKP